MMGPTLRLVAFLLLLALALVACGDGAADPAESADASNAGPEYRRIFASLPEGTKEAAEHGYEAQKFSRGMTTLLIDRQPYIEQIIQATRRPYCDFGVDYTGGMDTKLQHLHELRAFAKLLHCDTKRLLESGDELGAAERTAAVLRMSNHFRGRQAIVEKLVGLSCADIGLELCDEICARSRLGDEPGQILLAALNAFRTADLLETSECLPFEREFIARTIRTGVGIEALGDRVAKLTPTQREAVASEFERLMDRVVVLWAEPDAADRIEEYFENHPGGAAASVVARLDEVRRTLDGTAAHVESAKRCLDK